jgi:hypothetical protein
MPAIGSNFKTVVHSHCRAVGLVVDDLAFISLSKAKELLACK